MMVMLLSIYCRLWSSTSGTFLNWAELDAAGDTPGARYGHTMTTLADGTAVFFGGFDGSNHLNDAYTLTVSGTTASWASLSSQGDTPSARSGHSMTALADGTAVLLGGYDGGFLNDTYSLSVSGTTASWTSLNSQGDIPSARARHSMTALADGTAVLFGGTDDDDLFDDVYTLTVSGTTASWTSLNSQGDIPVGRLDHTMTVFADGTAVLFGGYNGSTLFDAYTLTVLETTASWASLSSQGDTPSARSDHSMTALADDTAVLFGGSHSYNILDDVYAMTLPTPSPTASPTASPTPSATASSNSTTLPTPSPTPSDELSASEHQHPFLSFLLLELFAAS